MINGFIRKKIQKLTLGEKLKSARIEKQVSLLDAEAATKVRAKYLMAIEAGKWDELPQEVYVRGFVLAYVKYLGLNTEELMGLFRIEVNAKRSNPNDFVYQRKLAKNSFAITPKLLGYFSLGVFATVIFCYIGWQFMSFTGKPQLKISSPTNDLVVENGNLDVSGVVENGSFVSINDEKVPITSEGHFKLGISLNRGVNVIKVRAISKTSKETQEIMTVEYKPKTALLGSESSLE
ncbi:MAG: helix-turn-helix domain-containing protein [Candidatus Berkelbacteria bacterium]